MNTFGYETVIENIKQIMKQKGIKHCVVAERAGFTQSQFSHFLNNRRKLLRVEHLLPIAEALEVSVNDLYYLPQNDAEQSTTQ